MTGIATTMANKYHSSLKDKSVQVSLEMRVGCGLGAGGLLRVHSEDKKRVKTGM